MINADIVVAESPHIEERIQRLRVEGIVRRAQGEDERFSDLQTTRRFLDELERTEGDQPVTLAMDLQILGASGARNIAVFWQEYREVVYGGQL